MITALISGQAARVVFIHGTDVSYIEAEEPTDRISICKNDISYVLGNANDIEETTVTQHEEAYPILQRKFSFDRALRMIDIIFSNDLDEELKDEATACLETHLNMPDVKLEIERFAYSVENPNVNPTLVDKLVRGRSELVTEFLNNLSDLQVHIISTKQALEDTFTQLKLPEYEKECFYSHAVSIGVFSDLVVARGNEATVESVVFDAYTKLNHLPNGRQIIQDWTRGFLSRRVKRSIKELQSEAEMLQKEEANQQFGELKNSHEWYESAQKQIRAITEKLHDSDLANARRYATDLIRFQTSTSGSEFAAKSLSNIAMEARKRGFHSVELEWAKQAAELAPEDGIALGVLGDTYLRLYRLDQAKEKFEAASRSGEFDFGKVGIARVLRAAGYLDDALAEFVSLKENLTKSHKEAPYVWLGHMGVLKDMSQLEKAVTIGGEAAKLFTDNVLVQCGYASCLVEIGEIHKGIDVYEDAIRADRQSVKPYTGKANALSQLGEFDRAIQVYNSTIDQFPEDVSAYVGLANTYVRKGEIETAIELFETAKRKFINDPFVQCGLAEAYRFKGDLSGALEQYDAVISEWRLNNFARNGKANILKLMGNFETALQAYDENIRDFPYDIVCLHGRADLLKSLGRYDEAIKAYNIIIERRAEDRRAQISKAAILLDQEKLTEAEKCLPEEGVQTQEHWVALNIQGMIALKANQFSKAREIFKFGLSSPFYRERRTFLSTLSLVDIAEQKFEAVVERLSYPKSAIESLLVSHSLYKLNKVNEAQSYLNAVNDNEIPIIHSIRDAMIKNGEAVSDLENLDDIFDLEFSALLRAA